MKVFVTGGSGFIGTAVIRELLGSGHRVLGLARSAASADTLRELGADVLAGDLENGASLAQGASACEGVIHLAFVHDFSRYAQACELDRRVIAALGSALRGTDKPLIVTAGTLGVSRRLATEEDRHGPDESKTLPRAATEQAVDALARQGVRAGVVRCAPSVHGEGDRGLVPMLMKIARDKGASGYIGEGNNRWNAVHRADAARVFVRALERTTAGARFHAVAETAIPFRDIATAIGARLAVPVVSVPAEAAPAHFGPFSWAFARDCPASSDRTQAWLDWKPSHPTLLDDLASPAYQI